MGTPGVPPSNIWNDQMDAPLVQTATYRFNAADRAYIDSQILGIQKKLLSISGGTSYFSLSQNVSAGGTISSAASAGTGTIALTGTPFAAFTYVLPAGAGSYQIVNQSGEQATIQIGSSTAILPANDTIQVFTDGTTLYTVGTYVTQSTVSLSNGLNSNVSITNPSSIRFNGYTGAVILGGIAPATAPTPGQIYQLNFTVAGQPVTIRNNDASSTSANRILTGTGSDVLLPPGQAQKCYVQWDGTLNAYTLQSSGVHQVDVWNVRDFGATGDGATDDTAAFNAAMSYASTIGGVVFVPGNGTTLTTYLVSSTIAIPAGVSLRGGGTSQSTVIKLASSSNPALDVIQINDSGFIENIGVVHGPTIGIQKWATSSSAFTVGQYVVPALPSSVVLKCLTDAGSTGANTPIGQLTPPSGPVLSGTSITGSATGIFVKIVTPGVLGVMQFQVSTNSQSTYGSTITSVAGNSYAYLIPGTGITVTFPGGGLSYSSTANPSPSYGAGVIAPSPLVVVSGAPNGAYAVDVTVTTGALGVMAFSAAINGSNKFNSGSYTIGPITSSSGNSWAHTDSGSGLTFTFYAGQYTNQSGPAYLSPSFGWSMAPGSIIIDNGYTWEVVPCGAPIDAINPTINDGGGFFTLRNMYLNGGCASLILDQAEAVAVEDCTFESSTMCGAWIVNGSDHLFGAESGVSNQITFRGTNTFYSSGYGMIVDGGNNIVISGGANFQNCGAGWVYVAGANAINITDVYVETVGGVCRNSSFNSRQSQGLCCQGFVFNGNSLSLAGGSTSALDMWDGVDFSATGNWCVGASTAMITGINNMTNAFEASNFCTKPVFDALGAGNNTIALSGGNTTGNWLPNLLGSPAQAINANSSSKQIVTHAPSQTVKLDTSTASGGTFVALMPVGVVGQRVTLKDITAAGGFNWAATPGRWSVGSGVSIENPSSPGTLVTNGTITAPAANGGAYTYEWVAEGAWILVS